MIDIPSIFMVKMMIGNIFLCWIIIGSRLRVRFTYRSRKHQHINNNVLRTYTEYKRTTIDIEEQYRKTQLYYVKPLG
jgi:hypothetical protein